MTSGSEWHTLVVSALVVAAVGTAWAGGWAIREATDGDPTALERLSGCLDEQGLDVASPVADPLAASAQDGSLTTTIDGNSVTVSLWSDANAAERTIATYGRLTSEDLSARAVVRDDRVALWSAPPTDAQASILYSCVG
jgi:hypothetical protein